MPLISIIIPLYNKEAIIEQSVQSVLSQSFKNFELIIVDDGSTDGSYGIVENIHDSRIRLIHQENGGPSKARNTGAKHARGEWILFLDADDELVIDALEHLYRLVNTYPDVNIVDGSYVFKSHTNERKVIFKEGLHLKNNYKDFFFRETLPSTGHTLFKSELIKSNPYNTSLRRNEDIELIFRILKKAIIITTPKVVFYVNTNYSSASSPRKHILEDFLGHLSFQGKTFWEQMCLYQFYIWERIHYLDEINTFYPKLKWRFDMLLLYKTLYFLKKIHVL